MVELSVILPVYQEIDNIVPLLDEIEAALKSSARSFEVIAVDDGSTDGSTRVLEEQTHKRDYLKLLVLRRNYGQATAFNAGFRHVNGDIVITMDSDRQNDPADILKLVAKLEEGYDFVSGWRLNRQDSFIRTIPSKIANWIIRKVTGTQLRDMGCSLKAYRKTIVENFYLYGEMHRFISVLIENEGWKTTECETHHRPRVAGKSKYGFIRVFKVILDLLIVWFMRSYQTKSMYIFGGIGILSMLGSYILAGLVLYQKYILGIYAHKNPLFIVSAFLGIISLQFLGLGLISELLSRTYFESQGKLTYNVKAKHNFGKQDRSGDMRAA